MSKHHHNRPPQPRDQGTVAAEPRGTMVADSVAQHRQTRTGPREKRLALLKGIEQDRASHVITYVTSSRVRLNAQIAMDVIRLFREILGQMGHIEKLDLVLITRGGNILAPLRLMSLLREYSKNVNVLVPYMAHSAGTLLALGADEIVMGAMGELGPVDPSVANQFNPVLDPQDIQNDSKTIPRARIPISVEDVTSYLDFAKSHAGLDAAGMAQAYSALTGQVHPLALGNILRTHKLIRHLTRTLLLMHMDETNDRERLEAIVQALTEKLYSHEYAITRDEASRLGLKVAKPSDATEGHLWELYRLYEESLGIDRPIDPARELGAERQKYLCFDLAAIEAENAAYFFCSRGLATHKGTTDFEFGLDVQEWERLEMKR